jgi:hypothetical protein
MIWAMAYFLVGFFVTLKAEKIENSEPQNQGGVFPAFFINWLLFPVMMVLWPIVAACMIYDAVTGV